MVGRLWASGRKPLVLWNLNWRTKEITEVGMAGMNPTTVTVVRIEDNKGLDQ